MNICPKFKWEGGGPKVGQMSQFCTSQSAKGGRGSRKFGSMYQILLFFLGRHPLVKVGVLPDDNFLTLFVISQDLFSILFLVFDIFISYNIT